MQGNRVSRSHIELKQALREQVELLQLACSNFDNGRFIAGRQMAVILRTLLLTPERRGSRTVPLLRLLNCLPLRFLSLAFSIDPRRLTVLQGPSQTCEAIPACGLVNIGMHGGGAAFFAPLDDVPDNARAWLPFLDWWNAEVLRDYQGRSMSRLGLVQHVADTDGGAHVDGGLVLQYAEAKSGVALGICIERDGIRQYLANVELHCMRQIAHEVLGTLRRYIDWSLSSEVPHPLMPKALPCQRDQLCIVGAFIALKAGVSFKRPDGSEFLVVGAA